MMPTFFPPSYRASQSDLTVAVSPLGLVELADEEFEVHGPRLSRYSVAWAWYLGHHYGYRREVGEPQFSVNFVRTFADYIANFCFGEGVSFRTPPATAGIVQPLLKRVWEVDNDKSQTLLEMAQIGGVTGDLFVKVAYEEPYVDTAGLLHPGRVRIIPLNSAHCFPTFSPHDRKRLERFKLKYRFWASMPDGTRGVNTYTEIVSEVGIEEYVNDELIAARPNPIGRIPIVHIPNRPVSGSPWGLSDIFDIIALNREYNEKALELSDIINYHASPIHVVIGAKTNQLQKGPRAIWGLPKDAKVDTLQAIEDFTPALGYLQMIKRNMHEITGVPENALGEEQAVSNTSGVALHIQYQPLMNVRRQKTSQYGVGIRQINELVLLTLFQKEPWAMQFDVKEDTEPIPGQVLALDPNDPNTYETSVHWPSPLPVDKLVKLNEIMMQKQLGLISDRESLMELGEEFPDQKRAEIFDEQLEDIKRAGALRLAQAAVDMAVLVATGMPPTEDVATGGTNSATVGGATGTSGGDGNAEAQGPPQIAVTPEVRQMIAELTVRAAGTKLAQYRNPSSSSDD